MIDDARVLALIPARAGSQRLPGKNLRPFNGRPLIDWTLDAALGASAVDAVAVTTDDPAVAALAAAHGATVIDRPAALAGADASVFDAIAHALGVIGGDWDYVALLQPTSPLRTAADVQGAVALCHAQSAPAVVGVSPPPKPAAFHRRVTDGLIGPAGDLDDLRVINGAIYVGRPDRLAADRRFDVPGALAWLMPAERGWDIDTAAEFAAAEAAIRG
ncbi:MAG: acylneuraminate cytidylyltransferase family protein [Brevundimonas sp.]|uniref:acylneuraminate cytidylyltransferase family protein n=1 Tax=Brevundimonas sp. TaxID=1871086 RepID=UPI0025BE1944|nr:acylneuraminate cytidylyltransferase family protein [Brevundimonas sp.]MBX3478347.1 acylneuraminate cytidylyltransferase family protein [Brevundimonas sp.]